ncbi:MAG: hypothetical protein CVT59_06335 [Actinobacteria bacterium HGW-Actinobacteria-1]|jgi:uncharacterized membrane protein|nr:MAG: hypothetical protein CVT59_06335 [Actinobacteria bacterium HGW-Actinobacteria-1]
MHRRAQLGLSTAALMLASSFPSPALAASAAAGTSGGSAWSVLLIVLVVVVIALLVVVGVLLLNPASGAQHAAQETVVQASESEAVPAERSEDADVPAASTRANVGKRNAVSVAIVAVFVIGAVIVVGQTTKPTMTEDSITREFTSAEPCVTALIPLNVDPSADPQAAADAIFSAIAPLRGLTSGTYDIKGASLKIGFCESETSESAIRAAIAPTGLLGEGGASSESTPQP